MREEILRTQRHKIHKRSDTDVLTQDLNDFFYIYVYPTLYEANRQDLVDKFEKLDYENKCKFINCFLLEKFFELDYTCDINDNIDKILNHTFNEVNYINHIYDSPYKFIYDFREIFNEFKYF
jgi:hypothetical protein